MNRLTQNIAKGQQGFTLVEMAVVIAIIGVLAAVATPLLTNYLGGAKERAYETDKMVIQTSVDAFFSDPANVRFLGKNQYPLLGRGETSQTGHTVRSVAFAHPDDGAPLTNTVKVAAAVAVDRDWNPLGGTQGADLLTSKTGGVQAWTDDTDGVREVQVGGATISPDNWTTVGVTRQAVSYHVDSRYYFIDMAKLVTDGFLKEAPKSASSDNSATGTGSYTYYVDDKGKVQTLLFSFPRTGGFVAGVYP